MGDFESSIPVWPALVAAKTGVTGMVEAVQWGWVRGDFSSIHDRHQIGTR